VKALLLIPLITALAYAQDSDLLELRGVVLEIGANAPLAGAQVTVYQFAPNLTKTVFGTIVTDSSGVFQFKPTRPGDYYVEAAKPDCVGFAVDLPIAASPPPSGTGTLITLKKDHPSEDLRLALMRLGELRGKVVDDDGKPLSRLRVDLIPETSAAMPAFSRGLQETRSAFSATDGSFLAKGLAPGNYVVRVSTGAAMMKRPQTDFTTDDENAVDQDFATSYWPGVADRAAAAVATVNPGGVLDLGNLRIHKEPRYRIHFVVHGCEPGGQLTLLGPGDDDILQAMRLVEFAGGGRLPGLNEPGLPCQDLLVGGLPAGPHRFTATTRHGGVATQVTLTDRNVTAPLTLIANGEVLGRVVMASGDPPPQRQPALQALGGARILPDAKGNFTITGVQCLPGSLRLNRLDEPYYIKELRVDGVAVSGQGVTLCAGSRLEIVLDDKTATLAVSVASRVNSGDKPAIEPMIFVQKWPESLMNRLVPAPGKSGSLKLTKLAPGEYRVLAVRQVALADGQNIQSLIPQLMDRATKVTLDAGDAKSISVNLIDPFL
jgi:Carboxypeptidase regulatory-like domain/Prealbumin-like fold domain